MRREMSTQRGREVEDEVRKQEFRKTVAVQQAYKHRLLKHTEKEEEDGLQLPDLWQGQMQGYLYAAHTRYSTGTLCAEVSRWGKREQDEQDKGSAGNKPHGIICNKKSVSKNEKFY